MAIGTGTIRGSEIVTEVGGAKPYRLNSSAVRSLAGAGATGAFRLSSLRGKSARTVSIYIVSSQTVTSGSGSLRQAFNRIVFGVTVSDGATPGSYLWYGDVNSQSAQVTFEGPRYQVTGFTRQVNATAYVNVDIGGRTFTASYPFTYTAGNDV